LTTAEIVVKYGVDEPTFTTTITTLLLLLLLFVLSRRRSQVARQGSAKPPSRVRIPPSPLYNYPPRLEANPDGYSRLPHNRQSLTLIIARGFFICALFRSARIAGWLAGQPAPRCQEGTGTARLGNPGQLVVRLLEQIVHLFEELKQSIVPLTPPGVWLEFFVNPQATFYPGSRILVDARSHTGQHG
jgi:hypothetical protein